ncbi:putative speckle-type POZ (SPOP) family, MATH domain protein [Gregarina niphandrodes]|uniref:Speckle-type POZ (SPOP) family, MATH domain protein n=1 Tax=Gregarina niphandrodes TaxID=110365 RepID=A0A023AY86_GRENI|nr:putative speckle-type POZ (SPOP) family, MATH domain protein [Gregarina niphandrodes]EZG43632.1 putative speckle-type POZ (SPOP) family, MATH domain protein [Gregarina niphandrodes]|eukprot:XP_011133135.1 putative speckle-type POZ (SPOP) family, MATH domain protein [Gregarina niphandrodes]
MHITCETNMEYDTVVFNWRVKNFRRLREIATENDLPPEGDVITSPVYVDGLGGCWWMRMYPYEKRENHSGKVSLFLHTDRATYSDVYFSFQFTALNMEGNPIEGTVGGVELHKFDKSDRVRNFGFFDFIDSEDLLTQCLDEDGGLWLYCEVHVYSHVVTELDTVEEEPTVKPRSDNEIYRQRLCYFGTKASPDHG